MRSNLKIAFIVRSTLYDIVGGDNLQVINTANELRNLNVEVDVFLANQKINYEKYDLIHLFNLIRPADHLLHIKKSGKPTVVSTIYLDYSDFDRHERNEVHKLLRRLTGRNGAEYLKNNFRFLKNQDSLVSWEYLLGHKRAVQSILDNANMLLPNSHSEYSRLKNDYQTNTPFHVVPNGINTELFYNLPDVQREDNSVLCVGQIYGLKNQHRLIEAMDQLGVKLTIIGKSPPNHIRYREICEKMAGNNVRFVDFLPQKDLIEYYAKSKVHALPSWFETTGLSSLEAGVMGCNLVVGSGGDTLEYFKSKASFCDAANTDSIREAVAKELAKPVDLTFREYILANFTWEIAAKETLAAYYKVLEID